MGGSWEPVEDVFPLFAGTTYAAGTTGGSADAIVVEHTHEFPYDMVTWGVYSGGQNANMASGDPYICQRNSALKISSAGENGAGKNMPPYRTFYCWERIA